MSPNNFVRSVIYAFCLLSFSVCSWSLAPGDVTDGSTAIWHNFKSSEKEVALAGYLDCASSLTPPVDIRWGQEEIARIDRAAQAASVMPDLLFALRNDRTFQPDPHAEHYARKYGIHTGEWWRVLSGGERIAYLRGAAWCSESFKTRAYSFTRQSTTQISSILNSWYVVSDEDASSRLASSRIDIPVYEALRKTHLLAAPPSH